MNGWIALQIRAGKSWWGCVGRRAACRRRDLDIVVIYVVRIAKTPPLIPVKSTAYLFCCTDTASAKIQIKALKFRAFFVWSILPI
ncbi:hypothetical protein [Vogesella oryzae]|uniref:hypothetical protein n=1 Tax=Vogesella oryzae TaxID=1735285 RepID=UPI0015840FD9|nr:hypothetical protein [Vogesella oryzae]